MRTPLFKAFRLTWIALLLTACGGGGGGNSSPRIGAGGDDGGGGSGVQTVLTGQFVDSAVSGIRYTTETRSGMTDSTGQFEYLDKETVTFYIGEQLLGDAPGAPIITLFDLVEGVEPLVGNELATTLSRLNENRERFQTGKRPPNYSSVINLAILLQTLDDDGNPDNGIEIKPEIAVLFAGSAVNFNQHWEDFKLEYGFRKVLAEAKSKGLLDSGRQVRKSWRAMAHLYQSMNLDAKLYATALATKGYGVDTPHYVESFMFDDEGKMTRRSIHDKYSTGYSDGFETYEYDTNGNLIRYENDYDGDSVSNGYVKTYTYDIDGNLTRWAGPTLLGVYAFEFYSYDAYGNQTRFEKTVYDVPRYLSIETYDGGRQTHGDYDDDGDGTIDYSSAWTYSRNGYQVHTQRVTGFSSVSHYDTDGNLLRREHYGADKDVPTQLYIHTYDAQGNEVRREQDTNGDSDIDMIITTTYDADSRVIRKETYEVYFNRTSVFVSNYDANGSLTHYAEDHDGDGIPEFQYTTEYEYDSEGNWVRSERDNNGDGTPDVIGQSTYDPEGKLIRRTYDFDLDGTPDEIYTWEYAAATDGWWSVLHEPQT